MIDQSFSKVCVFSEFDPSTRGWYCERFQKFAFSLISTRPHNTNTVAFSNFSTLEIVFESLHFRRKWYLVFIILCGRDMKMHPCGRGLKRLNSIFDLSNVVQVGCETLQYYSISQYALHIILITHVLDSEDSFKEEICALLIYSIDRTENPLLPDCQEKKCCHPVT